VTRATSEAVTDGTDPTPDEPATPNPPAATACDPAWPTSVSLRRRTIAMSVWAVVFIAGCFTVGLPTDPVYAFAWLWAATIAWNSHLPRRAHLRFGRDWAPLAVLLVVYNLSRGYADNGATPHVGDMIGADTAMWGWATGGLPPTVWLQNHFYDPQHVHWWDLAVSAVYFSHFVTAPTIAAVLWLRNRDASEAFMRRWVALFAAGLATYFIYPAAPPWWASVHGLIDPVARITGRGWAAIGLHGAGNMLNAAQLDAANPIAAMPSLHTAFATLCAGFFIPRVRARWRPLLACYPLAMTVSLVYSGEHWVIDTLFGIGYAVVILAAVSAVERLWRRLRPGHIPDGADRHRHADTGPAGVAAFGHEHATAHTRQGG
jgi:membrane-associated phospholipid phosphatase